MKSDKGITLVALVVTIIVLLILAAVSINLVLGDNGIITRAKQAKENSEIAAGKEKSDLEALLDEIDIENLPKIQIKYSDFDLIKEIELTMKEENGIGTITVLGQIAIEKDGNMYEAIINDKIPFSMDDSDFNDVEFNAYIINKIDNIPDIYILAKKYDDESSELIKHQILEMDESSESQMHELSIVQYNSNNYIFDRCFNIIMDGNRSVENMSISVKEGNINNIDSSFINGAVGYKESNNMIDWVMYNIGDYDVKVDFKTNKIIELIESSNDMPSYASSSANFYLEEYVKLSNRISPVLDHDNIYRIEINDEKRISVKLIDSSNGNEYRIVSNSDNMLKESSIIGVYGYKEDKSGNIQNLYYLVKDYKIVYANRETKEIYDVKEPSYYRIPGYELTDKNSFIKLDNYLKEHNYTSIPYDTLYETTFNNFKAYYFKYEDERIYFHLVNVESGEDGEIYRLNWLA